MHGKNILTAAIVSISILFNTQQITNAEVRLGSKGDEVVELQELLTWWGYLRDTIDGVAGQSTINALLNFQYDAGIYGDGVAGYDTFAVLRQEKPIPSEQPNFAAIGAEIKSGMQGAGVTDLQKNLIAWGYYHGAADGYMGEGTVAALKDFQSDAGLPVDGIAGYSTWQALAGNLPPKPVVEEVQKIETPVEQKIEDKIETKIETPVEQKIDVKVDPPVKEKTADKVETKVESNIELPPVQQQIETKVEEKTEEKKSKTKLKKKDKPKVEPVTETSVEQKIEDKIETKVETKVEQPIPVPTELPDEFFNPQDSSVWTEEIPMNGHAVYVEATAYSAFEPDALPYTTRGHRVRRGVVAVDPSFIPLGAKIFIPGYGKAIADDTGRDIVGNRIDIAFDTAEEAMIFGHQQMEIYLLDE